MTYMSLRQGSWKFTILSQNSSVNSRNVYYVVFVFRSFFLRGIYRWNKNTGQFASKNVNKYLKYRLIHLYEYKFPANLTSNEIEFDYFLPQQGLDK